MLQNFKASLDDCTVHGSHVLHLALGVQFVQQLLAQAKGDIQSIQDKISASKKAPSAEAGVVNV